MNWFAVGRKTKKWITYEYFDNWRKALNYAKYLKRIHQFANRYKVSGQP